MIGHWLLQLSVENEDAILVGKMQRGCARGEEPGVGVYDWIGVNLFQAAVPGPLGALLCAVAYTLACWLLGYALDRCGIVLRA